MQDLRSLVLLALAALVNAQSAPGFPIQENTNLQVDFQDTSTSVKPAGVLLNRDDVLKEPTIIGPSDSTRTLDYMVFIIDQDVTTPSNPSTRVQFLHWYQPNLSGASEVLFDSGSDTQNFTSATPLAYVPPTPPGGDIAHSYTILMYSQPKGFSIPSGFETFFEDKSDLSNRLDFDIKGFVDAAGLGEPVGANWFQVQNTTAPASTSSSSQAASRTTTSTTSTRISTSSTSSLASSSETSETTTAATSTETVSTSFETIFSTPSVESTSAPSVELSTSTAVVTALPTPAATSSSSSPSASASITPASGSGAGLVASNIRGVIFSLLLSVAGAGLWLL